MPAGACPRTPARVQVLVVARLPLVDSSDDNADVKDVDALFARAVAAGAEVVIELADQFWGDRYARLRDPFGHEWSLASRIEDLSPDEIHHRAVFGAPAQPASPR